MARQEMVDIQNLFENGAIINQQSLVDLSLYAGEVIDNLVDEIISYDDSKDAKRKLNFWEKILSFKTRILLRDFCDKDHQTKTLGVIEDYGWYVTYLYNDDEYRWSSVSEVAIYLALKVKEGKMNCDEAAEKLNSILQRI